MEQALRSSYRKTMFHMERLPSKTGSPFCTSSRRCFEYSQALSQKARQLLLSRKYPPVFNQNTKKQGSLDVRMEKLFHVERYYFYSVPCGTKYSLSQILKEEFLLHVEHLSSRVRDHFTQRATDVLLIESLFLMGTLDTLNKTPLPAFYQNVKKRGFWTLTKENCSTWKNTLKFS